MIKTLHGILFPYAETGTEGWLWALQENYLGPSWSYNDLYLIKDGDDLTIYDGNQKEIWSGIIQLKPNPLYNIENIHDMPVNFDKHEWIKIFASINHCAEDYTKCYTGKIIRQS